MSFGVYLGGLERFARDFRIVLYEIIDAVSVLQPPKNRVNRQPCPGDNRCAAEDILI